MLAAVTLICKREIVETASVSPEQVVDTTGAGDCFTASFAVAVLEGQPQRAALRFAGRRTGFYMRHTVVFEPFLCVLHALVLLINLCMQAFHALASHVPGPGNWLAIH